MFAVKITEWLFSLKSLELWTHLWTHLSIVWDKVPNKFGFFLTPPLIQNAEYNLKNSLKFKLLAFWRKKTPFIYQKCTYEKVTKKLGRPPPHPKEQQLSLKR